MVDDYVLFHLGEQNLARHLPEQEALRRLMRGKFLQRDSKSLLLSKEAGAAARRRTPKTWPTSELEWNG